MPSIFNFPPFTGDPQTADIIHVGDDSDNLDKKGTVAQFIRWIRGSGPNSTKLIDGAGTATSNYAISAGSGTNATGGHSFAGSLNSTASGANSFAFGNAPIASAVHSWATGLRAVASRYGEWARSSFRFAVDGDNQISQFHVSNQTVNATPTDLFLDGPASTQRITIPDNSVITLQALVTARRPGFNETAGYRLAAIVERNAGAGTTAIVGVQEKVVLGETVAAWDANIVADAVNGAVAVQVTGVAAQTIGWAAKIDSIQINM